MIDLAQKTVKESLKRGIEKAEAFFSTSRIFSFSTVKDKLRKSSYNEDSGIGLRVAIGKRLGFAYSTTLQIDELVKNAISVCKLSKPLKNEIVFPDKLKVGKRVFDKRIFDMDEREIEKTINETLEAIKNENAMPVEVSLSYGVREFGIVNSEGIAVMDKSSFIVLSASARKGKSTFEECQYSRLLEVNPSVLGKMVGENVNELERAKGKVGKIEEVVLHPKVLSGLLTFTILPSFYANNVQKHRSLFEGKVGKEVVSRKITFIDDGLMRNGWNTFCFDGEGTPPKRKFVVKDGILKTFLYDCYTAKKDNVESTGNAKRINFRETPSISVTNFIMKGGRGKFDDIISQVENGILVRSVLGAFLSNPVTADFSVKLDLGFLVKNGEIVKPVKGLMLAGNMLDALKNLELISKETLLAGSPIDIYTFGLPGQVLPMITTTRIKVT